MNPHPTTTPSEPPRVAWWVRWFRSRMRLQFWVNGVYREVWVSDFREKNDCCIVYRDYVTKKVTTVKSSDPIPYSITIEK